MLTHSRDIKRRLEREAKETKSAGTSFREIAKQKLEQLKRLKISWLSITLEFGKSKD